MGEGVDGVTGKTGYGLGENEVDFAGECVGDHGFESLTVSGVGAGDAFVSVHASEFPVGS